MAPLLVLIQGPRCTWEDTARGLLHVWLCATRAQQLPNHLGNKTSPHTCSLPILPLCMHLVQCRAQPQCAAQRSAVQCSLQYIDKQVNELIDHTLVNAQCQLELLCPPFALGSGRERAAKPRTTRGQRRAHALARQATKECMAGDRAAPQAQ
jgi:hypothetical protein